jgi:DeoR C terminal sensor domain
VHPQAGLTDYHPPEVITRRTIIAHCAASYVLADSSKLGAIALHRVCPLSRVTAVLTDYQASPEVIEALAGAGGTIIRAPAGGPPGGLGGRAVPPRSGGSGGSSPQESKEDLPWIRSSRAR